MPDTAAKGLVRVNFSLRGFAKLINQASLSAFTPEPAALEVFGKYLASLNLHPDDPLTFTSLSEFRGLDYVGYIVEKERLDPTTGNWIRLEEYRIIGALACSYKDTRVAYNQTYRYRIRSVAKFTGYEPTVLRINAIQRDLAKILEKTTQDTTTKNLSLVDRLFPAGLQPKSDTNTPYAISLSDTIKVTVDSRGQPQFNYELDAPQLQVVNSQALNSLAQLQTALASNKPISDTDLQSLINGLQSYTPDKHFGRTYLSEYIVSYPSRNWQYVVAKNNTLPDPPQAIMIVPSTPNKNITVYWLAPPDSTYDLLSVNLYRRSAVGDPWAEIAHDIALDAPSFVDTDVELGRKYIYALQSNSVHGYRSFLSTQVQAELNPSFQFERVEKDLVWISGPGTRTDETDTIFAAFYDTSEQLIAYKNIAVTPARTYNDTNTTIVLKIRSLDTQEQQDVVVNLKNQSLNLG